jgi:hypothetical protein
VLDDKSSVLVLLLLPPAAVAAAASCLYFLYCLHYCCCTLKVQLEALLLRALLLRYAAGAQCVHDQLCLWPAAAAELAEQHGPICCSDLKGPWSAWS